MYAQLPLQDAVDLISKGIDDSLKTMIKNALMEKAEVIVDEVATQILQNMKTHLVEYKKFDSDDIQLSLIINGINKEVKLP
jgi:hypothetical protein